MLLTIIVVSCKEEVVIDQKESQALEKASLMSLERENMLVFKSADALKGYISELLETDTDLLDEARESAYERGRVPLLLVYNLEAKEADGLGIKENEVAEVDSDDDMLLFLLNENGEIGIEDKIFRIDGEFVYSYSIGNSNDINNFTEEYQAGKVKIRPGDRIVYSKSLTVYMHTNTAKEVEEGLMARGQHAYKYFDSNHRMKARQFNGYWGFYSSIGAKTLVQKKKKFLWWSHWNTVKTDNRLEYSVAFRSSVTPGFPGYPSSLNVAKTGHKYCNCNQAQAIFSWSVGFPWAPEMYTPLEGQTKHWAHWYSSNPNTVSTTLYY